MGRTISENPVAIVIVEADETRNNNKNGVLSNGKNQPVENGAQANLTERIKSFLKSATDPKRSDPLETLGANAATAYIRGDKDSRMVSVAYEIGNDTLNETMEGIVQSLFFSAIDHAMPHTKYIQVPIETVFTALGVISDVAQADAEKKTSTTMEKVSRIAITTGTVIVVTTFAHAYFGTFAASLVGKGALSLVKGGVTAVLLESNPFKESSGIEAASM